MTGKEKKKKSMRKSLQGRIIIYNLCIVVLVALIGSIGTYYSAFKHSRERTKQSMEKRIEGISENFSVACEEMMNIILNCTGRNSMSMGSLDFTQQPSQRKQALINSSIMSDYCAISGYGEYITKLMISDKNGHFIQAGNSNGSQDDFVRLQETEWFEKEAQKDAAQYRLDLVDSPFFREKGTKIIPLVRPLDTTGRMREEGWGFLGISTELFAAELEKENNGDTMIAAVHDGTVIAGVNQDLFEEEELDKVTGMLLKKEDSVGVLEWTIQRKECLVAYSKNPISGILTYEVMPLAKIQNERNLILYLAVFLFLSCIIIGVSLAVVFSNRIRRPVDLLTNQVKQIGNGDFSYNPQIESEDELGEIGEGINRMSGRISQLLEKSVEDEREKKNLEIKMLQAQINPHFLYNTLDSIRWIAVIQKNASIVKMVTALSGLLKNMAKGFNEKVTLEAELKFLEDYITIEKMRYMEMFDVETQIADERLLKAGIIKLTLQPLVENAIFSGIEPGGKNGTIRIKIWEKEGTLCISVRDNGIGMSQEKIKEILSDYGKLKSSSMSGIGLPNVDQRIKLVYGEEYGMSISSEVGEYTEILVMLPIEYL